MSDPIFALPHEVLNPDEQSIVDVLEKAKSDTSLHPFAKVRDLGDRRCVKTAMLPMTASLQDACCTEYIRTHTAIPVPRVHMIFAHADHAYTVMDFVEGKTLEESSYTMGYTPEDYKSIADQLAGYVEQIRALPIPLYHPILRWVLGTEVLSGMSTSNLTHGSQAHLTLFHQKVSSHPPKSSINIGSTDPD